MSRGTAPDFVVRFSDVTLDQQALEQALRARLARYERARRGDLHYAQLNPPFSSATWAIVADWLEGIGPLVKSLIEQRLVASATLDFHIALPDDGIACSVTLPAGVALLVGRNLIDVEFSTYLTSSGH